MRKHHVVLVSRYWDTCFMPTITRIDNSNARLFLAFWASNTTSSKVPPCSTQIQHRQSEDNDEIIAHSFNESIWRSLVGNACASHKSHPTRRNACWFAYDKLVNQVAFRAHDFNAVVTCNLSKVRHCWQRHWWSFDLARAHFTWRKLDDWCFYTWRTLREWVHRISTSMK